jgi:ABC-type Mn2+/Zn2+ transport system permease subunit
MATVYQPSVPIASLSPGEAVLKVENGNNALNLLIYFIIIVIIVWILLYFINPTFIQQINPLTETHNGVPDMTKLFIWSVVIALIIVAIIYFLRR